MNVLDKHLAPHANALQLRQKRMEVIGANIANAATPNYKARDIDFSSAYEQDERPGLACNHNKWPH